ncbi:MAG: hypothetical protein M0D57_00150 [Sphingobacteriales bacterium JAD_PAG50586_3]|nr:MAG: hypothetical protein M0D57_00150 [Sphingobacteriales bacterium JAD_PAG50586_3]
MTIEVFCAEINRYSLYLNNNTKIDIDKQTKKRLADNYKCSVKSTINYNIVEDNELLKLVEYYNASLIHIGAIDFFKNVNTSDNFYYLGNVEIDYLVVEIKSGIVLCIDQNEKTLWKCADSDQKFLEALIFCVDFFIKRLTDEIEYDDIPATLEFSEKCGYIAGGKDCVGFYKMLFGV